jgi:LexA-binding, inner membrane-associated putative hydrolase
MAGFRMHVTTSALLGCGYAGVGHAVYGVPPDTAIVAGAMCGFSGMLPDLDSDYGVPLRETMAFTAAIVPMLLVGRFQLLELTHDAMVLVAISLYLFVRFGITNIIRNYTVHRGMFHSLPAGLIFAGVAFIVTGAAPLEIRCYKAGGVLLGFLSHLVLDEIYAVQWKSGQWKFKKSFGTALKVWGDDGWANFSTYAKLMIVAMMILGEPTVLERIETRHPGFAQQYQQFLNQLGSHQQQSASSMLQNALEAAQTAVTPPDFGTPPAWPPATTFQGYDTAQRPGPPYSQ